MATAAREIVGGLVRIYEPTGGEDGTDWRLRWCDRFGRHRDTSAVSLEAARRRAAELVLELTTDVGARIGVRFSTAVVAYTADARWNPKHGDQQLSLLRTWVLPWLGSVPTNQLRVTHTEAMLEAAATCGRSATTQAHIKRAAINVMRWAHAHDWMLSTHDPFSGARLPRAVVREPVLVDGAPRDTVRRDQIPSHEAMHRLAQAASAVRTARSAPHGPWWRELEYLVAAYGGLRWGERAALTGRKVNLTNSTILVDAQVMELDRPDGRGRRLYVDLPKWCRVRESWVPEVTPGGRNLIELLERRVEEVGPNGLLFPAGSSPDSWQRRSNHHRRVFQPAVAATPDWQRSHPLHAARHLYCSWLLNELKLDLDDVATLAGHSSQGSTKRYLGVRAHAASRAATAARVAGLSSVTTSDL